MAKIVLDQSEIPDNHTVVGYVAHVKVLDEEGRLYFSQRSAGLNDMEMVGLAQSMATSMQRQVLAQEQDGSPE